MYVWYVVRRKNIKKLNYSKNLKQRGINYHFHSLGIISQSPLFGAFALCHPCHTCDSHLTSSHDYESHLYFHFYLIIHNVQSLVNIKPPWNKSYLTSSLVMFECCWFLPPSVASYALIKGSPKSPTQLPSLFMFFKLSVTIGYFCV